MDRYIFKLYSIFDIDDDAPRLNSILVDGEPLEQFNPKRKQYKALIPSGRPRMPVITATADEDVEIEVLRPTANDNEDTAVGVIIAKKGNSSTEYKLILQKDVSLGFVLQYEDRYYFHPFNAKTEYTSSHPDIISVDEDGMLRALRVSSTPVTVTAHTEEKGEMTESITVNSVIRAQINIFLITGQSNASGTLDGGIDREGEMAKCDAPIEGTCFCLDAKNDDGSGEIYDLSRGRIGFSAPLGRRWYELTGEKCMMIQSAVGGSPIEKWIPGYPYGSNLLERCLTAYRRVVAEFTSPDSPFEIYRKGYFWCQGETGQKHLYKDGKWHWNSPVTMSYSEYFDKFFMYHNAVCECCSIDFGGIVLVRTLYSMASRENQRAGTMSDLVPVRSAQYAINNTTPSTLLIVSRICDFGDTKNGFPAKRGFGYFGNENLHYTQTGYNAQGREIAENTFASMSAGVDRSPSSLEILGPDGKPMNTFDTIRLKRGEEFRLAAITLPLYNNLPEIEYEISFGEEYCSVDKFGVVRFFGDEPVGSHAVLDIKSEYGFFESIIFILSE